MSDEMLKKIMMKADDDLDMLKDRCHDLYDEKEELKARINKAVEYIRFINPAHYSDKDENNLLNILQGEK